MISKNHNARVHRCTFMCVPYIWHVFNDICKFCSIFEIDLYNHEISRCFVERNRLHVPQWVACTTRSPKSPGKWSGGMRRTVPDPRWGSTWRDPAPVHIPHRTNPCMKPTPHPGPLAPKPNRIKVVPAFCWKYNFMYYWQVVWFLFHIHKDADVSYSCFEFIFGGMSFPR